MAMLIKCPGCHIKVLLEKYFLKNVIMFLKCNYKTVIVAIVLFVKFLLRSFVLRIQN